MNKQQTPIARKNGIVIRKLKDEVLVYDSEQHQAHCLNSAAGLIWHHCDGKLTVNDLSDIVQHDNPFLTNKEAEAVVWFALCQLEKSQLLELPIVRSESSEGLTRRRLIKVAGIAALVAVPMVSTIVAPTAASASTCLASGQSCTISAECCSGLCSTGLCA